MPTSPVWWVGRGRRAVAPVRQRLDGWIDGLQHHLELTELRRVPKPKVRWWWRNAGDVADEEVVVRLEARTVLGDAGVV